MSNWPNPYRSCRHDIQDVPQTQVDFADQQKRLLYCRDPEGNLLELCAFEDVP